MHPLGVIANDAGMGLGNSGADGLPLLQQHGIAAATVSATSARIGDALSTARDGLISAANHRARDAGVSIGTTAMDAARRLLRTAPVSSRGA